MGYRSDVAFVLTKEAAKKFKEYCRENHENAKDYDNFSEFVDTELCTSVCEESWKTSDMLFKWDNTKWYKSYTHVEFVMNFLNSLEESEYLFIILGEDWTDVRVAGSYFDTSFNLSVSKEICYD